jgi:hypothetical protein
MISPITSFAHFTVQIQLITGGSVVYDTGVLSVPLTYPNPTEPEPASLSIAAIGFLSLLAAGRRLSASNKSAK